MPGTSNIEWTEKVWNSVTGCTKVSPGCAHCYAEALTKRYAGAKGWPEKFEPWVPGNDTVVLHPDRLEAPLKWREPSRVFVNSMSDLFHEDVPDEFIDRVFAVMALTPQHTYQVLTKRPERMREYLRDSSSGSRDPVEYMVDAEVDRIAGECGWHAPPLSWPLQNVWLGVTVENQHWADVRIPILLDTPAAVRFVSAEPLLGPLDLMDFLIRYRDDVGILTPGREIQGNLEDESLKWVIVGGESGPRHRRFDPEWARDVVQQCADADVACFVKQMGGARPGNKLEDLPEDLRIRQWPK